MVQVQRFLTDASATGERDGLKDASEHFFSGAGQNLRAIAEFDTAFRGETDKITALAQNYYQTGTTMAEAYITQGREAGNADESPGRL